MGNRANISNLESIEFFIPSPGSSNQILKIGSIVNQSGTVTLNLISNLPDYTDRQWILSFQSNTIPLTALILEAEKTNLLLRVAYVEASSQLGQVAIVGYRNATDNNNPPEDEAVLTTNSSPTMTIEPTPTRELDVFMGRLMAEEVDIVINASSEFTSNAIYEIAFGHPNSGPLTWTEFGAELNGEVMSVDDATELTFYSLIAGDIEGRTLRLFDTIFTGDVTRLPDEAVYFQGHRMGEMLYWMVRHASDQGGQLIVLYDDFGNKQAITFIGFEFFNESP